MSNTTAIERKAPRNVEVQSCRPAARTNWTYRPAVDILETPSELQLITGIPGAKSEHIDVSFESGVLTIQAAIEPRHHESRKPVLHEYGVGNFHRRFEVDDSIDTENVSAEYREGVLTVTLPKQQHARRRQIPIGT